MSGKINLKKLGEPRSRHASDTQISNFFSNVPKSAQELCATSVHPPNKRQKVDSIDVTNSNENEGTTDINSSKTNTNGSRKVRGTVITNFFNQNDPEGDFETPKKTKVAPKITKTKKIKTSTKKQMSIKSALMQNEELFSNVIAQHSIAENVDPEEMQLALAMSRSEVKSLTSLSENNQEENKQISSESIREKLREFGFRTTSNDKDYEFLYTPLKRTAKWANKFTALTLRNPEKQSEKIRKNVERHLNHQFRNQYDKEYTFQIRYTLKSNLLAAIQGESKIFNSQCLQDGGISQYYILELFSPSKVKAGYLLKDYKRIPGRDASPDRVQLNILNEEILGSKECLFVGSSSNSQSSNVSTFEMKLEIHNNENIILTQTQYKKENSVQMIPEILVKENAEGNSKNHEITNSRKITLDMKGSNAAPLSRKEFLNENKFIGVNDTLKNVKEFSAQFNCEVHELIKRSQELSKKTEELLKQDSWKDEEESSYVSAKEDNINLQDSKASCKNSSIIYNRQGSPDIFSESELEQIEEYPTKQSIQLQTAGKCCLDKIKEYGLDKDNPIVTFEKFSSDEVKISEDTELHCIQVHDFKVGESDYIDLTQDDDCIDNIEYFSNKTDGKVEFNRNDSVSDFKESSSQENSLDCIILSDDEVNYSMIVGNKANLCLETEFKSFDLTVSSSSNESNCQKLSNDMHESELINENDINKDFGKKTYNFPFVFENSREIVELDAEIGQNQQSRIKLNNPNETSSLQFHETKNREFSGFIKEQAISCLSTNKGSNCSDKDLDDKDIKVEGKCEQRLSTSSSSFPTTSTMITINNGVADNVVGLTTNNTLNSFSHYQEVNEQFKIIKNKSFSNDKSNSARKRISEQKKSISESVLHDDTEKIYPRFSSSRFKEFIEEDFDFSDVEELDKLECHNFERKSELKTPEGIDKLLTGDISINNEELYYPEEDAIDMLVYSSKTQQSIIKRSEIINYPFSESTACRKEIPCLEDNTLNKLTCTGPSKQDKEPQHINRFLSTNSLQSEGNVSSSESDNLDKLVQSCLKMILQIKNSKEPISKNTIIPEESSFREFTHNDKIYLIKTENVQPMPDYRNMTDSLLLKELWKYGIKPLERKKAVIMLEYIYNQTHPFMVDTQESGNKDVIVEVIKHNDHVERNMEVKQNEPKHGNFKLEDCYGDKLLKGDGFFPEIEGEKYIFQTNIKAKVSTALLPFHIAWFNLFKSNEDLREAVLRYQPIDLQEIYMFFKKIGYRYNPKDIKTFFDSRCIIFQYNPGDNKRNWHVRTGKRYIKTVN